MNVRLFKRRSSLKRQLLLPVLPAVGLSFLILAGFGVAISLQTERRIERTQEAVATLLARARTALAEMEQGAISTESNELSQVGARHSAIQEQLEAFVAATRGSSESLYQQWENMAAMTRKTRVLIPIVGCVSAALAIAGIVCAAVRLNRRIRLLVTATEALAKGDALAPSVELARAEDELGELAERFSFMADQVAARDARIWSYTESLEEQVEARTREFSMQAERLKEVLAISDRRRQALEEANIAALEAVRSKTEFLANTSHEIRTPMNGILGLTTLLLDSGLGKEQRALALEVKDCAESLLVILNDILDYSKIEAKQVRLEQVSFPLRMLLKGPIRGFAAQTEQKGLRWIVRIADDTPQMLIGDPVRLRQCLLNLVSNAVKFTERGSVETSINVEARTATTVKLRFSVADTGIGIRAERQSAIWECFAQEDGSTTRRFGGTGLGLSIARRLVEQMGGSIEVQSVPGEGSNFSFTVELGIATERSRDTRAPAAPSPTSSFENRALRVLLVEDNRVNQVLASRMLEAARIVVTVANNGKDAVAAHLERSFDLILMDCQMPIMDGFAACAAIRDAEPPGTRVPIVALTANAMDGDRERCLRAGMDGYLAKPFQKEDLLAEIGRHVGTPQRS